MFISMPKEFFVPVVFSDDFRYNSANDAMEYDNDYRNEKNNREKLHDLDYVDYSREDAGFTAEYMENLININDKMIEKQVLNYSKSFLKLIEELKKSNCLDDKNLDVSKIINFYAKSFRDLYNDYREIINNVRMPISEADENQIIDKYIGQIEDMYNKSLQELNCKNIDYDVIEATMSQIFDDARDILKEEIRNINCALVNIRSSCKSSAEIKNEFNEGDKIYQKLDSEFFIEMQNR